MKKLEIQVKVALAYFVMIALLGFSLRLFPIMNLPINYKFFVHTHSHVALLGWVYTGLTTIIYHLFLKEKELENLHKKIFLFTQFTIIGMLFTFPFLGYKLFSILFSTLFLFATYWFTWFYVKKSKNKALPSYKIVKSSLWFLVLSSIGPWSLGAIMNTLGSSSHWYKNSIFFYLHFQYNGWFIVALIGIFFALFEKSGVVLSPNRFKQIYWTLIVSIIFTFSQSLLWMKPPMIVYLLSIISTSLQFFVVLFLWRFFKKNEKQLDRATLQDRVLKIVFSFLIIKVILQFIGSFPYFADSAFDNMSIVIGYLHWVFLGIVSIGILLAFDFLNWIKLSFKSLYLYLLGFFLTEGLLFYRGLVVWLDGNLIPTYYKLLALSTFILLLAIGNIRFLIYLNKKKRLSLKKLRRQPL